MVHNVIRGQGAAFLAIVLFLAYLGPEDRASFLLIAIAATLTLYSHVMTTIHHARSPAVMEAIGSLKSMVPLIALNFFFAVAGAWLFLVSQ